ncbi:hypothetical protein BDV93DRAFT_526682 [Ceratobasidium sp. AG-I]|nr:hypothetical protein BDV93DRAFT_526682 [Ceratobasidium sp. AG-I]
MSSQFAIDPALSTSAPAASTGDVVDGTGGPSSPGKAGGDKAQQQQQQQSPGYYSIFASPPPLPGWGPFPSPIFAPGAAMPMPVYMAPPPHQWHDIAQPQATGGGEGKAVSPHYHNPSTASVSTPTALPAYHAVPAAVPAPNTTPPAPIVKSGEVSQPQTQFVKPVSAQQVPARPRRSDPPPLNPAAAASPHYQNPGGFGGIYTPPAHLSSTSSSNNASANGTSSAPSSSHYTHKPGDTTLSPSSPSAGGMGELGRPFACGTAGCGAAFDRKSDCERHRRTHIKGAAGARPFRCGRAGCEAAFDRKDALMRHERNERTHLVRQTQPGRVKRPTRSSKSDPNNPSASGLSTIDDPPPRRTSTRKRKTIGPNVFPSSSDSELDPDSDGPSKRTRTNHDQGDEDAEVGMDELVNHGQLVIDPQLHGLGPGGRVQDEDYEIGAGGVGVGDVMGVDGGLGVGGGLGTTEEAEAMQAVEAIQAALQQIEADADAEKSGS